MTSAAARLKQLRESANPRLSVRALAREIGWAASTYATYEDPNRFKKLYLPMNLTQMLLGPLTRRGIEKSEVLALAGVAEGGELSEAPQPDANGAIITLPVALPPEAALARAYRGILAASREMDEAELAHELARQLPTMLAVLSGPIRMERVAEVPAEDASSGHHERQRA